MTPRPCGVASHASFEWSLRHSPRLDGNPMPRTHNYGMRPFPGSQGWRHVFGRFYNGAHGPTTLTKRRETAPSRGAALGSVRGGSPACSPLSAPFRGQFAGRKAEAATYRLSQNRHRSLDAYRKVAGRPAAYGGKASWPAGASPFWRA